MGDKIALEMKLHISRREQHRERWTNCIVEYMREKCLSSITRRAIETGGDDSTGEKMALKMEAQKR